LIKCIEDDRDQQIRDLDSWQRLSDEGHHYANLHIEYKNHLNELIDYLAETVNGDT